MKFSVFYITYFVYSCYQISFLTEAVALSKFYPFGTSEGDQIVTPNDDGSSGEVQISIPFPFFDQYHNSLFINTNGVISFLLEVSKYTPEAFPLGNNRRLVAPFWADVDTREGGQVFYRETTDPGLLQQTTDDVTNTYVNHRQFRAMWSLITTWNEVPFFGASGLNKYKNNTFQAVLITNGRHSFVIFNYNKLTWTTGRASGGNASGLGGTPAQAGFNAGDGIRYFNIPGSGTHQILELTNRSNVAIPGRWMFRVDSAKIIAGGCNTKGSLVISPRSVIMLGGDNILISGPCFKSSHQIVCEFPSGKISNGTYVSDIRAYCTVPMLNVTGRLPVKLSINGGKSFDFEGILSIVNINRFQARITRKDKNNWNEQRLVKITWDSSYFGLKNTTVAIELARYSMRDDGHVFLHSMYSLRENQLNNAKAAFIVPRGQGSGYTIKGTKQSHRFTTLVRLKKTGSTPGYTQAEWIWSDLFAWKNVPTAFAQTQCSLWHERQPDPKIYTDDASLLPCPQTLAQALADRGRFVSDEYCNPTAEHQCLIYHNGAAHCLRTIISSDNGAGQQCCYTGQGNLLGPSIGGSLDRFHIEEGVPVFSHFFHDILPYLDCCQLSDSQGNCEKYFEKRPSDNGSRYQPPRPAIGFGDPHMITLDGVEYTFNGYGEYHITHVAGPEFNLQGRMQPVADQNGDATKATVYKAFAMKQNNSDIVQIHISDRNEIEILVNGDNVEFNEQLMIAFNKVTVLKYNNTAKYSTIFESGISVTIEQIEEILQMMLLLPPVFKGNTSGLLGFWDGDAVKEFLLPNGIVLNTNSSSKMIHNEFGQRWATTANNSLFTYPEGKNHASYFDAAYLPKFLDQEDLVFNNATLGQQALHVCENNKQCLFDIHTTGKISIGKASKQAMETFITFVNETETPGCIPIQYTLLNGSGVRNDTEDGRIIYTFRCDRGFRLNGSAVISCFQGLWNGSKPSCRQTIEPVWTTAHPTAAQICNSSLLAPSGVFSTPNFPRDYPKNAICFWSVTLPEGTILTVHFEDFSTEKCCDVVVIRSGSCARRLSGDLGSFFDRPMTAKDNDTLIVIEFTSDGSVTKRGFKAYYKISPASTTTTAGTVTMTSPPSNSPFLECGGTLKGSSGSFGTPGFPGFYENNLDCTWTLPVHAGGYLTLKFLVFHTETCCDFVELTDSSGKRLLKYSGLKSAFNVSNILKVRFTSDNSVKKPGFLAHYVIKQAKPNNHC